MSWLPIAASNTPAEIGTMAGTLFITVAAFFKAFSLAKKRAHARKRRPANGVGDCVSESRFRRLTKRVDDLEANYARIQLNTGAPNARHRDRQ